MAFRVRPGCCGGAACTACLGNNGPVSITLAISGVTQLGGATDCSNYYNASNDVPYGGQSQGDCFYFLDFSAPFCTNCLSSYPPVFLEADVVAGNAFFLGTGWYGDSHCWMVISGSYTEIWRYDFGLSNQFDCTLINNLALSLSPFYVYDGCLDFSAATCIATANF